MVATLLNNLPPFVRYEGCTFQLVFVVGGDRTGQVSYVLTDVDKDSKHFEHWMKSRKWMHPDQGHPKLVRTLCTFPNVTDETGLRLAVWSTQKFLKHYNIPLK